MPGRQVCFPLHHQSVMGMTGVEPASDGLKARCITVLLHTRISHTGLEPIFEDSESPALSIRRTRHKCTDGFEPSCKELQSRLVPDRAHMSGQCSSRTNLFPGFNRTPLPFSQLPKYSHPNGLRTRISRLKVWLPVRISRWGVNGLPGI